MIHESVDTYTEDLSLLEVRLSVKRQKEVGVRGRLGVYGGRSGSVVPRYFTPPVFQHKIYWDDSCNILVHQVVTREALANICAG